MDEPDLAVNRRARKGFAFSMDAIFALALLLSTAPLLLAFLASPAPYSKGGEQLALGAVAALSGTSLESLRGNPRYPYANQVIAGNWTSRLNGSLAASIAELYLNGNTSRAYNLTQEFIGTAIPSDYALQVLIEQNGADCAGRSSTFSCVYGNSTGAVTYFAGVGRHFIYANNYSRELRVVVYK